VPAYQGGPGKEAIKWVSVEKTVNTYAGNPALPVHCTMQLTSWAQLSSIQQSYAEYHSKETM